MKYVFNVLLALIVVYIVWKCVLPNNHVAPDVTAQQSEDFSGARILKTCKNYFSHPISVVFDSDNDLLLVSNSANNIGGEDSLGYICRTSMYGEVIDTLRTGLMKSPKGVAIKDSILYIADADRVVLYNLYKDTVCNIIKVDGAMYLYDIEKDKSGNIFVSDSHARKIFKLTSDSAMVFAADSLLENVAGLCFDGDVMYAGAKGKILKVGNNGRVSTYVNVRYSVCGIKSDNNGGFVTSDFNGNVIAVSGKKTEVLVGKRNGINAADFEYVQSQRMLLLPTFADNSLEIYEIGRYLE